MSPEASPYKDINKAESLSNILSSSIKDNYLDDAIWEYGQWKINSFAEYRWRLEKAIPNQVQDIYYHSNEYSQDIFRKATTISISNLNFQNDSIETIVDHLHLSAYLRVTDSIPLLINIMDNPLLENRPENEFFQVTQLTGSILQGFADIDGINNSLKPALDRWLYDPKFKQIVSHFAGAIYECSPHDYAEYFQRVIDVNKELGEWFSLEAMKEMVYETIPQSIIDEHFHELSQDAQNALLIENMDDE